MNLSETENSTLTALMDCIIPEDDYPSASGAGVGIYIRKLFTSDMAKSGPALFAGINHLEAESLHQYGGSFAGLDLSKQNELFARVLDGKVETSWTIPPRDFARMCINVVSEGYYADPENGGNRDAISWKMIGFTIVEGVRVPVQPTN